jgi:hypothetical protein
MSNNTWITDLDNRKHRHGCDGDPDSKGRRSINLPISELLLKSQTWISRYKIRRWRQAFHTTTNTAVYLIGLSRFLQTAPVTYAGNCHEVDRQKQFRRNVQSNYGGYTSKHIQ